MLVDNFGILGKLGRYSAVLKIGDYLFSLVKILIVGKARRGLEIPTGLGLLQPLKGPAPKWRNTPHNFYPRMTFFACQTFCESL